MRRLKEAFFDGGRVTGSADDEAPVQHARPRKDKEADDMENKDVTVQEWQRLAGITPLCEEVAMTEQLSNHIIKPEARRELVRAFVEHARDLYREGKILAGTPKQAADALALFVEETLADPAKLRLELIRVGVATNASDPEGRLWTSRRSADLPRY